MRISRVQVTNYRNLNGLDVYLHPEMNFIVGDNELGKSNFLDLLDIIFNRRTFTREDFFSETDSIEVHISITLTYEELGTFEDYFDPMNTKQANFVAKQDSPDDQIIFYWEENYASDPKEINPSIFRRINFIKYNSTRNPKDELGFNKDRGVGRFLNYLVRSTLERNETKQDMLNSAVLDPIIQQINGTLEKIKPFQKMGVGTFADQDNHAELLARILLLKNENEFDIQKSGQGLQFIILLLLSILEKLINLKTSKRWKDNIFNSPIPLFSKTDLDNILQQENISWEAIHSLITLSNGEYSLNLQNFTGENEYEEKIKRIFERKGASIILGLDEPEIHLHPYMQRSLIKYITRILGNKDKGFKELLTNLLDLNEISGQALVVSHSPNILSDDYRHIVRFYKKNGAVRSISGCQLNFDLQLEKHLLMNFSSIKEAFFSKCVIVVEGRTELGAMLIWKDTYLEDADDLGISVIGADSCSSVQPIIKLLEELCIPNVSVMDTDDNNRTKYAEIPGIFFTKGRDFEEDIYEEILSNQPDCKALFGLLDFVDSGLSTFQENKYLIMKADKYGIQKTWDITVSQFIFSEEIVQMDANLRKTMFINFMGLDGLKSITFGRFIASQIPWIPLIYRKVMDLAKNMAETVI
jgi:putative ATP-dependent endonuclease of the OLD family